MDFFINTFSIVMGFFAALVAVRIAPVFLVVAIRTLTTRKWQARKYRNLIAQGKVETAQWAKSYGFATEE